MSLRTPARAYPLQPRDCYYTPRHATEVLLRHGDEIGLFRRGEIWECAAGAGHMARVLAQHGHRVLATDVAPPLRQLHPVTQMDFLTSTGPSSSLLSIVTNPPYGQQSRLALAFLTRAFTLMERRLGAIALLLPFEFDAPASRNALVGAHPWFVGKVTSNRRIRWANLVQKKNPPMGHHAWFIWSNELAVQRRARALPHMVSA